ncbi:MAG: hypothetical protein NC930_08635, partial [Candidatus Omnitrophica bacterium]|nr:hypothetical protein [Candidatus Omnitrophota bacterium]
GVIFGMMALYASRWNHGFFVILMTAVVTPYLSWFTNVRPHSFTTLLLIVYLLCLEAYRKQKTGWLWLFPPLMVVWVNLHGGFILGLTLASAGILSFYFGLDGDGSPEKPSSQRQQSLLAILLLTVAAVCVNPYGVNILSYLVREFTAKHEQITEWQNLQGTQLFHYGLFVLIPVSALVASRRWPRKAEGLFFFLFAFVALRHGRFMAHLIIFGTLVFFDSAKVLWDRFVGKGRYPVWDRLDTLLSMAVVCLAFLIVSVPTTVYEFRRSGFHLRVDPLAYPVRAVTYLKRIPLGPNLLLTFQWGGYALWHLYPDYRVSIDGRNVTVYPPDYIESYIAAYNQGDFDAFLDRLPVDVILIESHGKMYEAIMRQPEWIEVYRDATAAIFVSQDKNPTHLMQEAKSDSALISEGKTPSFFP